MTSKFSCLPAAALPHSGPEAQACLFSRCSFDLLALYSSFPDEMTSLSGFSSRSYSSQNCSTLSLSAQWSETWLDYCDELCLLGSKTVKTHPCHLRLYLKYCTSAAPVDHEGWPGLQGSLAHSSRYWSSRPNTICHSFSDYIYIILLYPCLHLLQVFIFK